jgi:hypothetical protein
MRSTNGLWWSGGFLVRMDTRLGQIASTHP